MTLEEIAVGFIGAMNRLADALDKTSPVPTAAAPAATTTIAPEPEQQEVKRRPGRPRATSNGEDAAGPTHEDALLIASEVAAKYDKAVVAQLVRSHTGSGMKIADLPKNKIQAFIASCEVMLSGRGEAVSDL